MASEQCRGIVAADALRRRAVAATSGLSAVREGSGGLGLGLAELVVAEDRLALEI